MNFEFTTLVKVRYDKNNTKDERAIGNTLFGSSYSTFKIAYHLNLDWDSLKMYIVYSFFYKKGIKIKPKVKI